MTIKSDKWIRSQINNRAFSMIIPFTDSSVKVDEFGSKIPSYGLSSYGYDIRLGRNFKIFKDKVIETIFDQTENIKVTKSTNLTASVTYEKNKRLEDGKVVADLMQLNYTNTFIDYIDVCNFDDECVVELLDVDSIIIPPHSFILGHSEERVCMPRDVTAVCMGKSTIARAGIIVTVTPIECGWSGYITLEITNTTGIPVKLQTGIGITQLQFFQSDEQCEVSYSDRAGKYQDQPKEPVTAT